MCGLHIRSLELSNKGIKREFLYYTNDLQDAVEEAGVRQAKGDKNVTFATVKQMKEPPETDMKYVVLRVTQL
jgi:hypothetical protein